ncbi:putative CtpA-like serine protease [Botrimarina colliarenosi]|uniref:Putative CtpA-like serine protease n=1 Tax=Botrimarina colliarenosi TaxID=2528001 RepID=A0A5C6APR6_9BACT|nr:S41 family peptidase [Botrimarina colliarenosi]TWU00184.1 putative CtpA-like serine protease [Botrimarina colliarenosi]
MSQLLDASPCRCALFAALLSLAPMGAFAEPAVALPAAKASESVAIPADALPAQADAAIEKGLEFESLGRWSDAVAHYERALRETPGERRLEWRFDVARLHSCLERRYSDASFIETLGSVDARAALELHSELLSKIESHYVVTPPWTKLTRRGAHAMLVATRDPAFQSQHGIRPTDARIEALRQELNDRLLAIGEVRNAREALRIASDLSALGENRIGAPAAAWTMEFVSAAAGGLDNYSAFLTPGQLRDVYSQIEGNFVGLGVELKADSGALLIVRVIPGSPAERASLHAGDRITAVDGQQTAALTTDEAAALLTGEEGSFAFVTVASPNAPATGSDDLAYLAAKPATDAPLNSQSRTVRVRREHVEVPSIEEPGIFDADYGVAYMRIPVFQKSTSRDVESALWDLHRQGMRTLVIDLRGNPGGLLTSAVELADKFVAQGNIVSTRGRSDGEDFDYRAHQAGTWRVPLVVLIDGDSASASEIFAAAIHDNRRGTIVGVRSFGKGSVQGIFPMTHSGAGIRLTTAKFYSPLGKAISDVGVSPDVTVTIAADDARAVRRTTGYRGEAGGNRGEAGAEPADTALARAIEVARQQMAMR